MTACFCDYDPAAVYRVSRPIARKVYRCHECRGVIAAGDRYERAVGLWEGEWRSYFTCSGCLLIRDHLDAVRPCFCWSHGGLDETLANELGGGWEMRDGVYVDTWPPGGRFRVLALMAQVRRERSGATVSMSRKGAPLRSLHGLS